MSRHKLPVKNFKWNSELAYAVGLLATDGNLSRDGRHIIMHSKDIDLIKAFQLCIDTGNSTIRRTHNDGHAKKSYYRLQFSKVQLYNWLIGIGIASAKTYTIGAIQIPNKFFRDFLRGHLDGDGSIYTYQDRHNTYKGRTYTNQRIYTELISASQVHALWLYRKICFLSGIKGALLHQPSSPNHIGMWKIRFAKKASLKLWQWIYYQPNLPCLKRKLILAQQLTKSIIETKRQQYTRII